MLTKTFAQISHSLIRSPTAIIGHLPRSTKKRASIYVYLADDFTGTIELQASLCADPTDRDWSTVDTIVSADSTSRRIVHTIDAKYPSMRLVVNDFQRGTIQRIVYCY